MIGSQLLKQAGIASSIAIHLAVVAWIVFGSGVRLFDPAPAEAITVDLVTPDEAKAIPEADGASQPDESKQDESAASSIVPGSPEQAASDPPAHPSPSSDPPKEQLALQSPAPPTSTPAPAPIPRAEPDITEKYGTMFSLSESGFNPVTTAAKIPPSAVATFRAHLKTCATLPPNVSPSDDVRVVLRIGLLPSGNLAAAPALIEASASAKGPLLMQAAIKALEACEPYDMLPADKYKEWQVLDLPFTPRDFVGG